VEFDAGDFMLAGGDGQREALKEREIDVHVERLSLKSREAVGDGATERRFCCSTRSPARARSEC